MQDISKDEKPYDNEYLFLATNLVVHEPDYYLRRLITDRKFLRRVITKEVKEQDFQGLFLDCIICSLWKEKQKQGFNAQLSNLGFFLYQQIDLPRLSNLIEQVYLYFYDEPLFPEK